jgi:hypothetical protein
VAAGGEEFVGFQQRRCKSAWPALQNRNIRRGSVRRAKAVYKMRNHWPDIALSG